MPTKSRPLRQALEVAWTVALSLFALATLLFLLRPDLVVELLSLFGI